MRRRDLERLRHIAVFDAVINNADRKGGHLLPTVDGARLRRRPRRDLQRRGQAAHRAVAVGRRPAARAVRRRARLLRAELDGGLGERLGELLTRREVRQTRLRVDRLLSTGRHPEPGGDWPPVPWPPI